MFLIVYDDADSNLIVACNEYINNSTVLSYQMSCHASAHSLTNTLEWIKMLGDNNKSQVALYCSKSL